MTVASAVQIPTLSARSVALSVLLGAPGGQLPVRDVVLTAQMCGISPATMRVALSRLTAAGELQATDGVYSLSPHHRERQRAQEAALHPRQRPWSGQWEMVVVVETGRDAGDRARLRSELTANRLAELREGVWTRPANLDRPAFVDPHTTSFLAQPDHPDQLVESLWDLPAWAATGHALLTAADRPDLDADRFATAAAIVRHLRTDPVLPPGLEPRQWPADALRAAYDTYRSQLHALNVRNQGDNS